MGLGGGEAAPPACVLQFARDKVCLPAVRKRRWVNRVPEEDAIGVGANVFGAGASQITSRETSILELNRAGVAFDIDALRGDIKAEVEGRAGLVESEIGVKNAGEERGGIGTQDLGFRKFRPEIAKGRREFLVVELAELTEATGQCDFLFGRGGIRLLARIGIIL